MKTREHIVPLKVYLGVWAALMVLTAVTIAVAQVHLGALNVPLALVIATLKAALVALFFMHLLYDEKFNWVVLGAAFLFVAMFLILTLIDPLTRGELDPRVGREITPDRVAPPTPPPSGAGERRP